MTWRRISYLLLLSAGFHLFFLSDPLHSLGIIDHGPTRGPAVGNFNGDGIPDLAISLPGSDQVAFLPGRRDGLFGTVTLLTTGTSPGVATAADLNLDGFLDLAVPNNLSNDVSVYLGNGDGTFGPETRFSVGTFPEAIAVADLNGDGNPDLATANFSSGDLSILLGNGFGGFLPETRVGAGFPGNSGVGVGDFNEDGIPDLAVANFNSLGAGILIGAGDGSFGPPVFFSGGDRPRNVVLADFNNDLHLDLAIPNGSTGAAGAVSVLLGIGNGAFNPPASFPVGSEPVWIVAGDFDSDGTEDLATLNQGSSDISILMGTGAGSFAAEIPHPGPQLPAALATGDFDADGAPDLAASTAGAFPGEGFTLQFGNGDGTFALFPRADGNLISHLPGSLFLQADDSLREAVVLGDPGSFPGGIAVADGGNLFLSSGADGSLFRVDSVAFSTVLVGPSGFEAISSLDFGPQGTLFEGILYGVGNLTDGGTGQVNQFLMTINTATGAGGPIGGPITTLPGIEAIAFTDDGKLFAAGFDPALGALLGEIDPLTGTARVVGPIGFWKILGLEAGRDGSLIGSLAAAGMGVRNCGFLRISPLSGRGIPIGGPNFINDASPACIDGLASTVPRSAPLACAGP